MATSALQSSFTSFSIYSNSSFLSQRLLSPISLSSLLLFNLWNDTVLFSSDIVLGLHIWLINRFIMCVCILIAHYFSSTYLLQVKLAENPCLVFAKLKRWERKKCKPNSLPILHKMHVKFGDIVKVISGRDKDLHPHSTIVIKDVNLKTKHMKSHEEGEPGQIVKIEAPIHSSNVMMYSKEKEVVSRVGHKVLEDGQKVRILSKPGSLSTPLRSGSNLRRQRIKQVLKLQLPLHLNISTF
ncbi:unnamed protein product [Eruca vesicaria subsp. sativa]|uniref:Large ribosomal subunit protein uL24 C-terminal domain-containing protein n=1 Tax=Eruca vesicaria subsp. sativa TaxID=29727 RepID=A0ABC8KI89_ERUVS|nr:unnamed protein product [Eruca vesicaria subsp. sativa]